jgi:hypothetical protein
VAPGDDPLHSRGGYRTTRLHEALGPQARFRYVDIARLDSVETWRSAVSSPEFAAITARITGGVHTRPASWTQIAIWTRLVISSLTRMWETWALTVARLM